MQTFQDLPINTDDTVATVNCAPSFMPSLPLGVKVSKLKRFGKMPVQFTVQYGHNFADDQIVPEDLYSFTVKFLLPSG